MTKSCHCELICVTDADIAPTFVHRELTLGLACLELKQPLVPHKRLPDGVSRVFRFEEFSMDPFRMGFKKMLLPNVTPDNIYIRAHCLTARKNKGLEQS